MTYLNSVSLYVRAAASHPTRRQFLYGTPVHADNKNQPCHDRNGITKVTEPVNRRPVCQQITEVSEFILQRNDNDGTDNRPHQGT